MQSPAVLAKGFYQISYVVADLDEAQRFFRQTFGVAHFGRLKLKARSADFKWKPEITGLNGAVALADMGGMELELIAPSGPGWYADFVRRKGPGLHHLGFRPGFTQEDFESALSAMRDRGHEPVAIGSALFDVPCADGSVAAARTRFAYFDLEVAGASCIEISVPDRAFLEYKEAVKAGAL